MARPVVSDFTERLYARVEPLAYADEENGWPLLHYCQALSLLLEDVDGWVSDTSSRPGWHIVLDADEAPSLFLPWLAQFVGVKAPGKLPAETEQAWVARTRQAIKDVGGFKRGTPASIAKAVQSFLSGTKEVTILERDTSPYHFEVRSRESETPLADVPLIEQAIRDAKPAGLQFVYARTPDWTYDDLDGLYLTYDALDADFVTYDDIDNNNPIP